MIYVVTGPPCGGKSTYVTGSMRPGAVRVDFDLIAQALGGTESHDPAISDSVFAAAAAARRAVVGRVLDTEQPLADDSWLIWQRVPPVMADRLEAVGAQFLEVDPGKEECLRRASEDGRPQRTFDGIEQYYAGEESEKGGREVRTKSATATVKTAEVNSETNQGIVTMLVSVFGNVDSYGDEVVKGAFAESLAGWASKGAPIPFVWAHQWANPEAFVGGITAAAESDAGLEVTAQMDLDRPFAAQVFHLLKERRITQASFAYDVLDGEFVEREAPDGAKYEVYELRKLHVLEAGPCFLGVNRETELLDAKAREAVARAVGDLDGKSSFSSSEVKSMLRNLESRIEQPHTSGKSPGAGIEPAAAQSAQSRARLTLTTLEGE